ncbi:MAG: hypothetical protein IPL78_00225 [Chloroflexi bacterium]|nr:hypothetical protein [Chloroflexota bacterium]
MNKRKLFTVLALVIIMTIGVVATSLAQGPDGAGWWASFTIQNATSTSANVVATAYDSSSGSTYNSSVTLPGDYSVTFHPGLAANCTNPVTVSGCRIGLSPALPAGFEGSAVISSDSPVYAITSVNNNASGSVGVSNGAARSFYQGVDGTSAATKLYFPTVKHNFSGQSTVFFVQAAGADANVTISYRMNNGNTYTQNQIITANKMFAFAPLAAGVPSCNGGNGGGSSVAPCFGGATVTSDTPVAGVVIEYIHGASVANYVLATRGLSDADAGTIVAAPAMKNSFNGGTTGATILNTGLAQATVNLDFTVTSASAGCPLSPGHTTSDSVTIAPGASVVVNQLQGNTGDLDTPAQNRCVFYSMVADSNQPIVVTVNENRTYLGAPVKAVYSGFNTANASDTVYIPLYKEFFNGQASGLTVVNASASTATVIRATFTSSTGSTHVVQTSSAVAAGAAVNFFELYNGQAGFTAVSGGMPAFNTRHSVVVEAVTAGVPIVAINQESDRDAGDGVLDITNYEGFNQ